MTFAGRSPSDAELYAHYRDYGHGWFDSPITRERYRELIDSFEPHRVTNRIFDSGCGPGYFLEEARAQGWEVHGSEYSARALALNRAKDIDVVEAPITIDTYDRASFDVITAFEVVEHLRDPLAEAAVLAHALRPGGLLYCTTPNFDSVTRRLLREAWSVIDYPEHLFYFTPATLRSWLGRFGFIPEAVTTAGVSLSRLREGLAATPSGVPLHASDDERLRTAIEHSTVLRLAKVGANATLAALGIGDTIKARFRLARDS